MSTFEDYRKLVIAGATTSNDEDREPEVDPDYIAHTTPTHEAEEKTAQDFHMWNALVERIAPTHPTFVAMGA